MTGVRHVRDTTCNLAAAIAAQAGLVKAGTFNAVRTSGSNPSRYYVSAFVCGPVG